MNNAQNLTLEATLAQSQAPTGTAKAEIWLDRLTWLGRILLLGILAITPWEFGAVDPWAQRQIAIVIGICLAIWWFETALRRTKTQVLPFIFVPVALGILIGMFQLFELPSSLASIFLGRQTQLYQELGADLKLSPTISLSHEGTRYFVGLLTLAISGLVLGCRYFRTRFEVTLLLTVMTVNGALISFFGMVQSLTSQRGFIYWTIELVNGGIPFGPYVNRNNSAGFLLICLACSIGLMVILMANKKERGPRQIVSKEIPFWRQFMFHLMLFLSDLDARKTGSILATILIAIGIISTLSRGGVLAMMLGFMLTLIFYGMARRPSFTGFIFIPMVGLAIGIAGWVGFADKFLSRLDRTNFESNNRISHWQETWPAISDMGTLGSGLGSYEHVHRLYRTTAERTIFTFAESQFFQTLVEMGWLGLLLLAGSWALLYHYAAFALWRGRSPATIALGTMGIFLCISLMAASAVDFGLYQSANMIAMAVVTGALAYNAHSLAGRLKDHSWLQYQVPNSYCQVIGLVLFSGVFVAGLGLHNRARIDSKRIVSPRHFTSSSPDLETTERLISELQPLVRRAPVSRGLNYLSLLYVQRMRLQHFSQLLTDASDTTDKMSEEQKLNFVNNLWVLTSLEHVHEHIYSLKRESSVLSARAYQQQSFIQENIRQAINALNLSRRSSLLQPSQQIRLTRLYAILGATRKASKHAAIAAELAPGSLPIYKLAGTFHLQSGNSEQAAPFIRRYLELAPQHFNEIADLISGRTARKISPPDEKTILDHFLPDDPKIIYEYMTTRMLPSSPIREEGLRKADQLLNDVSPADHTGMVLSARVKLALGLTDEAIKLFKDSLVSNPTDFEVQTQIVSLLNSQGKYRESIGRLEDLMKTDYINSKKYSRLLKQTRDRAREQ